MAALRWEPTHVTKHCPRVVPLQDLSIHFRAQSTTQHWGCTRLGGVMKWSSNKDVVWLVMRLWWHRCETVSTWDSLTLVSWLTSSPALHTYMDNSCRHSPQSSTTWVMSEVCYYIVLPIPNSHLFCIATLSFNMHHCKSSNYKIGNWP